MGESPPIKYMVLRCATHFRVAYEATPVPGQEIAPLIHSGNQATKDRGLMRGQFPGAGFSGTDLLISKHASKTPFCLLDCAIWKLAACLLACLLLVKTVEFE
jgi:hypothetical protein